MKIDPEVLRVLADIDIIGNAVVIREQLDRPLYIAVDKVLQAAGGKWSRARKAHLFTDAPDTLERAVLTGEITFAKQEFDFFETPQVIIDAMIVAAEYPEPIDDPKLRMKTLEPSAGTGRIAKAVRGAGSEVWCYEMQADKARFCSQNVLYPQGPCVVADFMNVVPAKEPVFDRVIMNPPFSKRQDVKHILHAWKFLKSGGRLVAIASAGVTFRTDALTKSLRDLVDANDGEITPLPEGAFKESGTGVNTVMIVAEKYAVKP